MAVKHGRMPNTPYTEQYQRRIVREGWMPDGIFRDANGDMAYQQLMMPVVSGDQIGINPDRYRKIECLEEGIK